MPRLPLTMEPFLQSFTRLDGVAPRLIVRLQDGLVAQDQLQPRDQLPLAGKTNIKGKKKRWAPSRFGIIGYLGPI